MTDPSLPVWGLLVDEEDGSVLVRVVDDSDQYGNINFTLWRVYTNGAEEVVFDFPGVYDVYPGDLNTARLLYSLAWTSDGDIILAIEPRKTVYKMTPTGTVIWQAGYDPSGTGSHLRFLNPTDIAVDRRDNVWCVDRVNHCVVCRSSDGEFRFAHGQFGDIDDVSGEGMNAPSGVAVVERNGKEFLYVADAGNMRILKYKIRYPTGTCFQFAGVDARP